jgi:hypothetical protein
LAQFLANFWDNQMTVCMFFCNIVFNKTKNYQKKGKTNKKLVLGCYFQSVWIGATPYEQR